MLVDPELIRSIRPSGSGAFRSRVQSSVYHKKKSNIYRVSILIGTICSFQLALVKLLMHTLIHDSYQNILQAWLGKKNKGTFGAAKFKSLCDVSAAVRKGD